VKVVQLGIGYAQDSSDTEGYQIAVVTSSGVSVGPLFKRGQLDEFTGYCDKLIEHHTGKVFKLPENAV
jgi:hypothetical protein